MQFLRAIGIAALTFGITMPVAHASLVTLEFEVIPGSMKREFLADGVIQTAYWQAPANSNFSVFVQFDADHLTNSQAYGPLGTTDLTSQTSAGSISTSSRFYEEEVPQELRSDLTNTFTLRSLAFTRSIANSTPRPIATYQDLMDLSQVNALIEGDATHTVLIQQGFSLTLADDTKPYSFTRDTHWLDANWLAELNGVPFVGSFGEFVGLSDTAADGSILRHQTLSVSGEIYLRSVAVAAIPEPTSLALMSLGMTGLLMTTRRYKARSSQLKGKYCHNYFPEAAQRGTCAH